MWAKKVFLRLTLIFLAGLIWGLMAFLLIQTGPVYAATSTAQPTPSGPDRYTTMTVDITLYEWWLVDWKNNDIQCSFWADHEGLPYDSDVFSACGKDLYDKWKAKSVACDENDITECKGFYLVQVGTKSSKKEVPVILPPAVVWVSLEGCEPDPDGWCTGQPVLVLTGEEPLPNESITSIHGFVGSDPFTCAGSVCKFQLKKTEPQGVRIQFWAYSTFGDSSKIFTALLRVLTDEKDGERLTPRLYVDVLSTQWTGQPAASCAQAWEAFPPPEGLPEWLTTPDTSEHLESNIPYAYLAGNLISQGVVDVSACQDGGLLPGGTASACGLEAAKPAVEEWQNRFDKLIFEVATDTQVPAQLLKNIFSRESQFWPGVFRNMDDVGLGQLTEDGADTALLWNPSFYNQFCPLILNKNICRAKGYANLKPKQQALLRGALVGSVDARCADCPLGLDLSRADFSVEVFAHTLLANCEQAGKIVQDVTGKAPGLTVPYEDMWRFTLVNYNAGPGCLSKAMKKAHDSGAASPLSWENVSSALDEACQGAIGYVDDISQVAGKPIPTPTPTPTPTPIPTSTPEPTATP